MSRAEPTPEEVLAWLARTGEGATAAVTHFWPGAEGAERNRKRSTVASWKLRAERAAARAVARPERPAPPPPAEAPEPPEAAAEPERPGAPWTVTDTARAFVALDRVRRLEAQLGYLHVAMERAQALDRIDLVIKTDVRLAEVGQQLDTARGEAGRVTHLDRDAGAVAEAVLKRSKKLALLAQIREQAEAAKAREKRL